MDSMKYFGSSFDNIVELAGTDLNGMLTGNIQGLLQYSYFSS